MYMYIPPRKLESVEFELGSPLLSKTSEDASLSALGYINIIFVSYARVIYMYM